jgi:signal transduction histidine kinase
VAGTREQVGDSGAPGGGPLPWLTGLAAGLAALVAAAQTATLVRGGAPLWSHTPAVVAVLALVAGVVVLRRRPQSGLGPLLLACGASLVATNLLVFPDEPVLVAIGLVAITLPLGTFLHLVLALPSGRLPTRSARRLVLAGYVVVLVGSGFEYLLIPGPSGPYTVLRLADDPTARLVWQVAAAVCFSALMLASAVHLARRIPPAGVSRAALRGLQTYGVLAIVLVPVIPNALRPLLDLSPTAVGVAQLTVLAGIPVGVLVAVVRGGLLPASGVAALTRQVAPGRLRPVELEAAIARAVGDPTARLVTVDPATGAFVAPLDGTRPAVEVRHGGRLLGAIEVDPVLEGELDAVRAAADVVALVLEREALEGEIRRSRERVVAAADAERRRIAQDLHDGVQSRLVLLAIRAGTLTAVDGEQALAASELRDQVDAALRDLRDTVQAVMPSALLSRDLPGALEDLADRLDVPVDLDVALGPEPLPAAVESTAYFVAAEAVANVVRHAGAAPVRLALHRTGDLVVLEVADAGRGGAVEGAGRGLRGLRDRVEGLGGTFSVASAPGAGTTVRAELPCGW